MVWWLLYLFICCFCGTISKCTSTTGMCKGTKSDGKSLRGENWITLWGVPANLPGGQDKSAKNQDKMRWWGKVTKMENQSQLFCRKNYLHKYDGGENDKKLVVIFNFNAENVLVAQGRRVGAWRGVNPRDKELQMPCNWNNSKNGQKTQQNAKNKARCLSGM